MRVLASADVHGKLAVYEWLLRTASERQVDAIVLAGDLLGCPDGFATPEEAQQHEGGVLSERLSQAACPVLFIMGNDDLVELPVGSERVRSLHGRRVQVGSYAFVGYQYSLPFRGGAFEKPDTGIASDLKALEPLVDARTVFVSHSPALGV
jgi:Icc-related predicted phosphoesterase